MADASDSKSDAGNSVWVQVPSPALIKQNLNFDGSGSVYLFGIAWCRYVKKTT